MQLSFAKPVLRFTAFILVFAFFYFNFFQIAVLSAADLAGECAWEKIEAGEKNLSSDDYRALLEKCKKFYEERTDELEGDIAETKAKEKNLSNAIANLVNRIKSLDYQIYQGNIMVKDLSAQIDDTKSSIDKTESKINEIKEKLGNILQLRYEEDQRSTVEILLSEDTLSDFFDDLVALEMLNLETQDFLKNIQDLKVHLESQKTAMDQEKGELENVVIIQTMQKQESAANKTEQEYLLQINEVEYEKYVAEKEDTQEKVVEIGNRLFELLEVPEGGIKFEDAVEIAKDISKQTGVRAAFSLAVLWQETKIGKLKGGCFLQNPTTGDGIYIKTGNPAPRTMKPTRDVNPFLSIVKSLNSAGKLATDSYHTPVSCCMIRDGSYFGWGGAMGPAQFIASTWMLFKDDIEDITGNRPANPWNVRDAFLANSLYLKNLGASAQTYEKEIYAALRYFGCTSWWCRVNYGEPVMNVASCLQSYISNGAMSNSCRNLVF